MRASASTGGCVGAAAIVFAAAAFVWLPSAHAQDGAGSVDGRDGGESSRSGADVGGPAVHTNTAYVEAIALGRGALWAATRGGLERYDLESHRRSRLYTTLDGLARNALVGIRIDSGSVVVETGGARCTLHETDRFECAAYERPFEPRITPARTFGAGRITDELPKTSDPTAGRYVATTDGLFFVGPSGRSVRLTPDGQICSNHITDVVAHGGRVYFGAFNEGVCVRERGVFRRLETPFRMVNDLQAAGRDLYVAASEGLFRSQDGETFARFRGRTIPRGVNGLAYDGRHLFVTTPASLHRVRLARVGEPSRGWWLPAGSTAIQDVAVRGGEVWLVTEDRGAVRIADEDVVAFDRAAGLPTSWFFAVDVGPLGAAWVGSLRHGLLRIDAATRSWAAVPIPDPWLLRVRVDRAGLLVGTQGGAFVVRGDVVVPVPDVPDPRVHEVARVSDTLWVGTEGGTLETRFP